MDSNTEYFWLKCYDGITNAIVSYFDTNNVAHRSYNPDDAQYDKITNDIISYFSDIKKLGSAYDQGDEITKSVIEEFHRTTPSKDYMGDKHYDTVTTEIICYFARTNSNFDEYDDVTKSIITSFNDSVNNYGYHPGDAQYDKIIDEVIIYFSIIKKLNQCDEITKAIIEVLNVFLRNKTFDPYVAQVESVKAKVKRLYKKLSFELIFLDLARSLDRRMLLIPNRTIHCSDEILNKASNDSVLRETLEFFKEKISKAESLIDWHSKLINDSVTAKKQDVLFNHWNIKHLHFAIQPFRTNGSANADKILLLIENTHSVYLLDIINHPHACDWTAYNFLQVLKNNNWLDVIGFSEMEGVQEIFPVITNENNDDLYEIFKSNTNLRCFKMDDKCYFTVQGVNVTGHKEVHLRRLNNMKDAIAKIESTATLKSFNIAIDGKGKIGELNYNVDGIDKTLEV